jgi:alkylhydroperoxidase/carboxymuconolactone decarboxylase family protein YurZ
MSYYETSRNQNKARTLTRVSQSEKVALIEWMVLETTMAEVNPERVREVVERVERERGMVRGWTRILAERDPDMLERLHDAVMHPLHRRDSLSLKTKLTLMICLNAFQFHEFGVRAQTRAALQAGATEDEILEALEIVGLSNLHGMSTALPTVIEEFEAFKVGAPMRESGAEDG